MSTFEVKTPALVKAMNAFDHVIEGTKAGTIEIAPGRNIISAGRGIVSAVGQELRVRTAMAAMGRTENAGA